MLKKMKNIEMVEAVNGLSAFVAKDKDVPVALSCAISGNIKTMIRELEPYEEERKKIAPKEGEKIADEDIPKLLELYKQEVEVQIRMVSQDVIESVAENAGISTKDIMTMEFMIESDE